VLDRLPYWREGDAKGAILAFVDEVTTSGSAGFVPPAARIAVFDNDDWSTVFDARLDR
jgi:hypothetical protein